MDPIANVLEQRDLAEMLLAETTPGADFYDNAVRLAELVQALDDWKRKGGFDPYAEQPEILR